LHLGNWRRACMKAVCAQAALHFPVSFSSWATCRARFRMNLSSLISTGLAEKIVGPLADRLERVFLFRLPGDDDDLRQGSRLSNSDRVAKPSWGLPGCGGRPSQVAPTEVVPAENVDGAGAIFGQDRFVIVEQGPLHLGADLLVVVNNQQLRFQGLVLAKDNRRRKVVPLPCSLSTSIRPGGRR